MRLQLQNLAVLSMLVAGVVGLVVVPAQAGSDPSGISPDEDRTDLLRARLAATEAELETVKQDIRATEDAVQELSAHLTYLKKLYGDKPTLDQLLELNALSGQLSELREALDEFYTRADKLQQYIDWLTKQLEDDGPTISIAR